MDWIIANKDLIIEVVSLLLGIAIAVWRWLAKMDAINWDNIKRQALKDGQEYLEALAARAIRELTEADVRRAAYVIWGRVGGPDEWADEFSDLLWTAWAKYMAAEAGHVRSGLVRAS